MGLFSKVTKAVKGIASNPTDWKNYANAGAQAFTFGQADMDGLNLSAIGAKDLNFADILSGKKGATINPDEIANQIRATQMKGIGELNKTLDTPAENIVREGAARQTKGILSSAQDARRNAQRLMAQKGLGGTSLGLGLNRSITQDAGNQVASVNAQLPGMIRNQQLQDAQTRIGVGGVNQNGMNFNTIEGARTGGVMGIAAALAPMAGQAAGAYKDYQTGQLAARR